MDDLTAKIDELAALMDEFSLQEAEASGDGWRIAFRRQGRAKGPGPLEEMLEPMTEIVSIPSGLPPKPVEHRPAGTPVNSPMNGIFYSSPTPSAPSFVKPGEAVAAGQVVGLIEAMKVFNEIVAPISGIVDRIVADNGQLVQPGDALLFII